MKTRKKVYQNSSKYRNIRNIKYCRISKKKHKRGGLFFSKKKNDDNNDNNHMLEHVLASRATSSSKRAVHSFNPYDAYAIVKGKETRFKLMVIANMASVFSIFPGGVFLATTFVLAHTASVMHVNNLKFSELLSDVLLSLIHCYRIFSLINRSNNVFLIAIHNTVGLDNLYKMLYEMIQSPNGNKDNTMFEKDYENKFNEQLDIAKKAKNEYIDELDSNNIRYDHRYLLYNIHQSPEIKDEIERKMKTLFIMLLECTPEHLISKMIEDEKIKRSVLKDIIMNEYEKRKINETKNGTEQQKGVLNTIKSKVTSLKHKLFEKIRKIEIASQAEEKMFDTHSYLTSINNLFIVMKTHYDEAINYYEKHLDDILATKNNTSLNISNLVSTYPTVYEKANYIIEFSNEYIDFMVPSKLQTIAENIVDTANTKKIQNLMAHEVLPTVINEVNTTGSTDTASASLTKPLELRKTKPLELRKLRLKRKKRIS